MVRTLPPPLRKAAARSAVRRAGLLPTLLAVLGAAAAGRGDEPGPPTARVRAAAGAASAVGMGRPAGALAVLSAGRGMFLWDLPADERPVRFEDLPNALPLDPSWLDAARDEKPLPNLDRDLLEGDRVFRAAQREFKAYWEVVV